MDSMRSRIKNGELFSDHCEGLPEDRKRAKLCMSAYNKTTSSKLGLWKRKRIMKKIFGKVTKAWIEPPFYFCYGTNIKMGNHCYVNVNCSFIDDGEIEIGDGCEFGPNVVIATVGHPLNPKYRPLMYTRKVSIEKNCWIGGSVTILPGVTIGENSVVGAGSVVTKDIPANSIAYGNPCKAIRQFNEEDLKYYNKNKLIDEEDIKEMKEWERNHR